MHQRILVQIRGTQQLLTIRRQGGETEEPENDIQKGQDKDRRYTQVIITKSQANTVESGNKRENGNNTLPSRSNDYNKELKARRHTPPGDNKNLH